MLIQIDSVVEVWMIGVNLTNLKVAGIALSHPFQVGEKPIRCPLWKAGCSMMRFRTTVSEISVVNVWHILSHLKKDLTVDGQCTYSANIHLRFQICRSEIHYETACRFPRNRELWGNIICMTHTFHGCFKSSESTVYLCMLKQSGHGKPICSSVMLLMVKKIWMLNGGCCFSHKTSDRP